MRSYFLSVCSIASCLGACVPGPSDSENSENDEDGGSWADASAGRGATSDGGGLFDAGRAQAHHDGAPQQADPRGDGGVELEENGEPHPVFSFAPSNADLTAFDLDRAPALTLDCREAHIDSSAPVKFDAWCGEKPMTFTHEQPGGSEVVVIPLASLTVAEGTELRLTGDRPVVFLVQGNVAIRGVIDASAHGSVPGAGGSLDCGASAGGDGAGRELHNGGGGGGGGFATAGGAGGTDGFTTSKAGKPGVARGNAELVPLLGGCSGGYGGGCAGRRGAGGGALQISASGSLTVSGAIRVDGGEGARGCQPGAGGTGGGSGGGLLLEAKVIRAQEMLLSAAGGAGGAGETGGEPGAGADTAADPGGAGAAGSADNPGGGAGGGGFGRIRLRVP